MAIGLWRAANRHVERLFTVGGVAGLTEAQLLDRFVARRDEAAFEAIVTRHGPMVLNVCRRLLRDPNDVDDAFQATFLVLMRRAGSLRNRDLLGNWLYGVAWRVALRARSIAARRSREQGTGLEELPATAEPDPAAERREWLHEEVRRLPDKYRAPVVLCYLEGLTHDDAAGRLGWPVGTVKGRLARARDLLRARLGRRGLSAGCTLALLADLPREASAAVPPALTESTLRTAASWLSSHGAGVAAGPVLALTEGVVSAMNVAKLKSLGVAVLVAAGVIAAGATVRAYQSPAQEEGAREERPDPPPRLAASGAAAEQERPDAAPSTRTAAQRPMMMLQAQPARSANRPAGQARQPRANGEQPGPHATAPPAKPMHGAGGFAGPAEAKSATWAKLKIEASVRQEIAILSTQFRDSTPTGMAILRKLEEPIAMNFANETPLEDILKYIRSATQKGETDRGLPIYVDPEGLALAEKTPQSPVQIDLEGIPLKVTLRLVLRQLGLAYCVKDGVLMISDPRIIVEELKELEALQDGRKVD